MGKVRDFDPAAATINGTHDGAQARVPGLERPPAEGIERAAIIYKLADKEYQRARTRRADCLEGLVQEMEAEKLRAYDQGGVSVALTPKIGVKVEVSKDRLPESERGE